VKPETSEDILLFVDRREGNRRILLGKRREEISKEESNRGEEELQVCSFLLSPSSFFPLLPSSFFLLPSSFFLLLPSSFFLLHSSFFILHSCQQIDGANESGRYDGRTN
jgi:hypothetical protein